MSYETDIKFRIVQWFLVCVMVLLLGLLVLFLGFTAIAFGTNKWWGFILLANIPLCVIFMLCPGMEELE